MSEYPCTRSRHHPRCVINRRALPACGTRQRPMVSLGGVAVSYERGAPVEGSVGIMESPRGNKVASPSEIASSCVINRRALSACGTRARCMQSAVWESCKAREGTEHMEPAPLPQTPQLSCTLPGQGRVTIRDALSTAEHSLPAGPEIAPAIRMACTGWPRRFEGGGGQGGLHRREDVCTERFIISHLLSHM